ADELVALDGADQAQGDAQIARRRFDNYGLARRGDAAALQVLDQAYCGLDLDRARYVETLQLQIDVAGPGKDGKAIEQVPKYQVHRRIYDHHVLPIFLW